MFNLKPIDPFVRWGLIILCLGVIGISTGCTATQTIGRPKVEYTVLKNKNYRKHPMPVNPGPGKRTRKIIIKDVRNKGDRLLMYIRPEPKHSEQYVRTRRDGVSVSEIKRNRRNSVVSEY